MRNDFANILIVRITKCSKETYWYKNKIGSTFIVLSNESKNRYDYGVVKLVTRDSTYGDLLRIENTGSLISMQDAEILNTLIRNAKINDLFIK